MAEYKIFIGKMSSFGGPADDGVSPTEGLALYENADQGPSGLFLSTFSSNSPGLARSLNPNAYYCAMRWDYTLTPKAFLLKNFVSVRNPKNGFIVPTHPVDWGPNITTGRLIDLSPAVLRDLRLNTDDEVEVCVPYDITPSDSVH